MGTSKGGGKQWQTTPKNLPSSGCSEPEPYRSHDWALVPDNPVSKAECKLMVMTGVIILPPRQRNALVERTRTAIPTWNSPRQAKQTYLGIRTERKGKYTNKHNTGTLLVVIVSTERLKSFVLIFYRTEMLGSYHHL